jgi:hypothetical protein
MNALVDNNGEARTADELGPGHYFVMLVDDLGLTVYGEALDSSYPEDKELIDEARERGYIFGRWYSSVVPDGELGSNHISRCTPISEAFFRWGIEGTQ